MAGWRSKLAEGLLLLVVVAVAARVIWGLLGPLLVPLIAMLLLGGLITLTVRGPRSGGGLFHK
jgi:hypothetical protein